MTEAMAVYGMVFAKLAIGLLAVSYTHLTPADE